MGLSPLARGKRVATKTLLIADGPIPAGAGETAWLEPHPRLEGAYPRWRGGNYHGYDSPGRPSGLSPLARGKPGKIYGIM